jgi:glycosyltransferase involved in cell wall biosynthesis
MVDGQVAKKISINGRFLCRTPTGVDRYATELLRSVDGWYGSGAKETSGLTFEIVTPRRRCVHWIPRYIPIVQAGVSDGYFWEQCMLPMLRRDGLLVSLCNTGPVLAARHVVAIHDATPARIPGSFSKGFRTAYKILMPALGQTSRAVVTVSHFSAGEIQACYGVPNQKIHVIGNSGEHILRADCAPAIIDRLGLDGVPYVLAVATMAKHKNIQALLGVSRALFLRGIRVVLVGGDNQRIFGSTEAGLDLDIIRAGYVTDGELRSLYQSALCFVFPSIYEGFGIPPLEAMQLGCPVVASNTSALPEVLADAALYASPLDQDELFAQIMRINDDVPLRQRLVDAGRLRAANFRWDDSARALLRLCKGLLEGRRMP